MIEPVTAGAALLRSVDTAPSSGASAVRLGHSGVLLRFQTATVIVDPYLCDGAEAGSSARPARPHAARAPLDPAEIDCADLILCTSGHFDHFDGPTLRLLRDASPSATLVCPNLCIERTDDLGWPGSRVAGMSDGDVIMTRGLRITAFEVASAKLEGHRDERWLGYAIHAGDLTVVHVGNGRATRKLAARIRSLRPDVAFLPISGNGRRERTDGVAPGMSAAEAVELAVEAGTCLVIPQRYDVFTAGGGQAALAEFERHVAEAGLPARTARVGELIVIEGVQP